MPGAAPAGGWSGRCEAGPDGTVVQFSARAGQAYFIGVSGFGEGDSRYDPNSGNFTDTNFRGSSEKLRVIERFTRTAADTLLYQFKIEDETTWAKPWSGEIPMKKALGQLFEYACHEGNYGMAGVLAGARAEEKAERGRSK